MRRLMMNKTIFESILRDLGIHLLKENNIPDRNYDVWEEQSLDETMTSFGFVEEGEEFSGSHFEHLALGSLVSFIQSLHLEGCSVYIRRYPELNIWLDKKAPKSFPLQYCYTCRLWIKKEVDDE